MDDDVIDTENNMLDFDDTPSEERSTPLPGLNAQGSLSDVEVDYETRSEISEDDEDNAEDIQNTTSLSKDVKENILDQRRNAEAAKNHHSTGKSGFTQEEKAGTKATDKRNRQKKTNFETDESGSNQNKKKAEETSTSKHSEVTDSFWDTISHDARFFILKTSDARNLKVSQAKQVWFTDPQNVAVLNSAVKDSKNVILIFSAKWSGKFSGFALLKGKSTSDDPPRDWSPSVKTLGGLFRLKWLSRKELLFSSSNHLKNPSSGKLVSICSDGQEIDGRIGRELCQLLHRNGIEPEESTIQRNADSPVESGQGGGNEREKYSSKSRTSRRQDHKRGRSKERPRRRRSSERERSAHLRRDTSSEITRIRHLRRSGSNLSTHSPVWDSDGIGRKSLEFTSDYVRSERRGRSPVRREYRVRGGYSSDRNLHSSMERSRTRERYHSQESFIVESEESPVQGSIGPLDLRHKTSRGRYLRQGPYDRGANRIVRATDNEYDSSGDAVDESSSAPVGLSGRLVIERSPIRQTVASPPPVVKTELSPDDFDLMSEVGSEHRGEPSSKAEITSERYCTVAPSLPVEMAATPVKLQVSHVTSETSRGAHASYESVEESRSRGELQAAYRDNSSHESRERRSLSRSRSQDTYNNKGYPSYEVIEKKSSSHRSETTRGVYTRTSHETVERSQSPRSGSRGTLAGYASREISGRRLRSRDRSRSSHRVYESHETTRRITPSPVRRHATHRDYTYESSRIRSQSFGRTQDKYGNYHSRDSTERSSGGRLENSPKRYSLYHSYRQKAEERSRVMSPETIRRYSEPKGSRVPLSLHHRFPELKRKRDSSELQDEGRRRYMDERSSYGLGKRRTPDSRPYSPPTSERPTERVPEYHYKHSNSERHDSERYVPAGSGLYRSGSPHASHRDQRPANQYGAQLNQNPVPQYSMTSLQLSAPGFFQLPNSHQNHYQSLPPPVLPPVSSKFLGRAPLLSTPNYNPTIPPPMVPPAPSKYIDDVLLGPAVPPPTKLQGLRAGGVWAQEPRTIAINNNLASTHKNLSEKFIEFCNTNMPMRGSTVSGSRRRY